MYHNPVKIIEADNWLSALKKSISKLNINHPLVISSLGNIKRNGLFIVFDKEIIFDDIENNPTFESCQRAIDFSKNDNYDGVIAIGGGSVMDTAKTVMAAIGTRNYNLKNLFQVDEALFTSRVPAIFIPTTHGTASEVTMWGTVWNMNEKRKYSLSYLELYPDIAVLDGSITKSLPLDISITTVLDALSHCFEAMWNINVNDKSTEYAIEGIKKIFENVPLLKKNPQDRKVRHNLLIASNLAGLAFSNTKTAAAHSISYPLTISHGIPHGIACSITIVPLLRINEKAMDSQLSQLYKNIGINNLSELEKLILDIPKNVINFNLKEWQVDESHLDDITERSFTKSRMANNVIDLNRSDVLKILKESY